MNAGASPVISYISTSELNIFVLFIITSLMLMWAHKVNNNRGRK